MALREYNVRYYANNREKCIEARRRWVVNNRDKYRAIKRRAAWKANGFVCSEEQYEDMLAKQGGACAICAKRVPGRLVVDHKHGDTKARGLLCGKCNSGIAFLCESPAILHQAIKYLS